jgi:hypothetical protein
LTLDDDDDPVRGMCGRLVRIFAIDLVQEPVRTGRLRKWSVVAATLSCCRIADARRSGKVL